MRDILGTQQVSGPYSAQVGCECCTGLLPAGKMKRTVMLDIAGGHEVVCFSVGSCINGKGSSLIHVPTLRSETLPAFQLNASVFIRAKTEAFSQNISKLKVGIRELSFPFIQVGTVKIFTKVGKPDAELKPALQSLCVEYRGWMLYGPQGQDGVSNSWKR